MPPTQTTQRVPKRSSKPIVQCVEVHRSGNVLAGQTIHLLILSAPISGGADCPRKISFLKPRT